MELIILVILCLIVWWLIDKLINTLVEILLKVSQGLRSVVLLLLITFLIAPDLFTQVIIVFKEASFYILQLIYDLLSIVYDDSTYVS